MSRLRIDFLNWRPDDEAFENDGLTVATNVIHDTEGYKPVYLASAGSFVTTGGLTTATSVIAKPVGSQGDLLCAWMNGNTLHVGVNGVTATTLTTGYPLSYGTTVASAITAFDVCELGERAYFVVLSEGQTSIPNTAVSLSFAGYINI